MAKSIEAVIEGMVVQMKNFGEDLKDIKLDTKYIKDTLNSIPITYLSIDAFTIYEQRVEKRFKEYERKRWAQNTLSAAVGVIFTTLIGYVILNLFHRV